MCFDWEVWSFYYVLQIILESSHSYEKICTEYFHFLETNYVNVIQKFCLIYVNYLKLNLCVVFLTTLISWVVENFQKYSSVIENKLD